ncbi:MAG: cystathionine beta-lyase [Pseudomonadota bacterium]
MDRDKVPGQAQTAADSAETSKGSSSRTAGLKPATILVRGGYNPADFHGFVNPPVIHASTVLFPNVEASQTRKSQRYTYGRRETPTNDALCDLVTELEGAAGTILASTGLAACTIPLAAVLKTGDRILMVDNVYHPTRQFCDGFLKRFGVTTVYFDPTDLETYRTLLAEPTAAVFLEAPGSLTFEVCDIPALAGLAKAAGAVTLMDNTWATPLYFRPLEHGCDISIQAGTKYFAGHSDLLIGTIACNDETLARVHRTWDEWGEHVAPDDVYATTRGIRTLDVRLARHQRNALRVAQRLAGDRRVYRVLHPALPDAPGHALWKRDFSGATGLFAITFKDTTNEMVSRFVDRLRLFGIGYSWGGYESLATVPIIDKWRTASTWPQDERVVRLSIGLEDPDDLIDDLMAALSVFDA